MKAFIGSKVLVTTSNWFYGPDGKQYRGVWGTLHSINEAGKELGFIPNRAHANWFLQIGTVVIMGCQAMYVIQTDTRPPDECTDYTMEGGKPIEATKPTSIYCTL
jgi:hypothetical protein